MQMIQVISTPKNISQYKKKKKKDDNKKDEQHGEA